jgi:glycosyltransferase involved in cell wall biosynthesis
LKTILCLTLGINSPAGRFRALQWVPYLEKQGFQVTVRHCRPSNEYVPRLFYYLRANRFYYFLNLPFIIITRILDIHDAAKYDFVFLQRPLIGQRFSFLERWLFKLNKNVIFDFDDAIFVNFDGSLNKGYEKYLNFISQQANRVVVGNSYLKAFAQSKARTVDVIPTCIDTQKYHPNLAACNGRDPNRIVLGWIGTSGNFPYLKSVRPVLRELVRKYPQVTVRIVSEHPPLPDVLGGVPFEYQKWTAGAELEDLCGFDIGIMPLEDSAWSRGKCGFKLIQYMACGKPVVASPIGANTSIVEDGENGFLVSDEAQWIEKLSLLFDNPELRRTFGQNARQKIKTLYSTETYQAKFVELFEKTIN